MPPAYEVLLLNTAIPQIQAAQSGDTYVVPRDIAFSTVASLAAGTEALPSLVATGDVNTGFWFPAADTIAASTGGTRRLTIDASGNLGLGVTPSAWSTMRAIQNGTATFANDTGAPRGRIITNAYYDSANYIFIAATSTYALNYTQDGATGQHQWRTSTAAGTAGNTATLNTYMTLDASGNLGIGTTSPQTKLHGAEDSQFGAILRLENLRTATFDGDSFGFIQFYSNDSSSGASGVRGRIEARCRDVSGATDLLFSTAPSGGAVTERARITSGGDLLVGTNDAAQGSGNGNKLVSGGGVWVVNAATADGFSYYNSSAAAYRFYVSSAGTISATNTTISAISDQRLKENIQDLDVGLNKIMALKPRKFDWKEGKGKDIKGDRGWIAQEFEQVFPDMIDEWKDPAPEGEEPYKSVRADLIPVLVKAIQELKAEVDSLKAQLEAK